MPKPALEVDVSTFLGAVGAEIRRRRLKKFPRAADAAKAARVPTQTWYSWERGKGMSLTALPIAAKALGCSPRQLLPA